MGVLCDFLVLIKSDLELFLIVIKSDFDFGKE